MKTLICDCNRTMPIDGPALARAVGAQGGASVDGVATVHHALCRREAAAFQKAAVATTATGEPLVVGCTQEQRLFVELNGAPDGAAGLAERPIRFVNLRETGGWSRDARQALPKMAALLAAAQLPPPDPVPVVGYASAGRCLVIGDAPAAEAAAALIEDRLDVTLLLDGPGALPQANDRLVHRGRLVALAGWLGAFEARWEQSNPIDLDLCTRCNACIRACPEGAIDWSYRIDLQRCRDHRDCVAACQAPGAIDFARAPIVQEARFDLVLDLRAEPAFTMHQPPQGYRHVRGGDPAALAQAASELARLRGRFDKPTFFRYRDDWCAHSRNEQIGCTACIDVCSTRAIRSNASLRGKVPPRAVQRTGDTQGRAVVAPPLAGGVVVEPHLCVGCGACSTVCPTGAMGYGYPDAASTGRRWQALIATWRAARSTQPAATAPRDAGPVLLVHDQGRGRAAVEELGRAASIDADVHGVPAHVIPVDAWHVASTGLDLWLAAVAFGAAGVWLLTTATDAPEYRTALDAQIDVGNAVLQGLGLGETFLRRIDVRDARDLGAFDAALREAPAAAIAQAATFAVGIDKRGTLDLALDHLITQRGAASAPTIDLAGTAAPWGTPVVDPSRCTLCMGCVGACPPGALADNPSAPQLRVVEQRCVQCGLCAQTCPEDAITLQPRLWLADDGRARRRPRVLHEAQPFACIRCGTPFATAAVIERMVGKLSGHPAFQGDGARRLQMCSDCRVIDLFEAHPR